MISFSDDQAVLYMGRPYRIFEFTSLQSDGRTIPAAEIFEPPIVWDENWAGDPAPITVPLSHLTARAYSTAQ